MLLYLIWRKGMFANQEFWRKACGEHPSVGSRGQVRFTNPAREQPEASDPLEVKISLKSIVYFKRLH